MLVGFELFRRLRRRWHCIEVYPQATAVTLRSGIEHKRTPRGFQDQFRAGARYTRWPAPVERGPWQKSGMDSFMIASMLIWQHG